MPDLSVTGSFLSDKLALLFGADNLTDRYPDRTPIAQRNPNGGTVDVNSTDALAFSRYSPFGFDGRFIYTRAIYNW